jgi:hypothetical protein
MPDTGHAEGGCLAMALVLAGISIPFLCLVYHLPFFQTAGFFIGIAVFLYLPGVCVLELLGWKDNPVSLSVLSILAGMALTPIAYYLAAVAGVQWAFPVPVACASGYALYKKLPGFPCRDCLRLPDGWWKGVAMLIVVLAALHLSHFSDLHIEGDGGYRLSTTGYTETIYHLGIINAAGHGVPPVFPYASGYSLSEYHIDMHLVAVIFCKYLGIDATIMTFYFLPFLLMFMILAVPAVFFYDLHKDVNLSLFFGLLMLGADFSFMPILWKGWNETFPWTLTFCTTIWSLFTLNGIMAAVPLFFGSVLAFQRFFSSRDIRHLIVFSLFTIASYRVKSSMGLQVIGVAFGALAYIEWRCHTGLWKKALPVLVLTGALIFLDILMKASPSGSGYVVRWDAFNGLISSAGYLAMDQWRVAALDPWGHPLTLLWALAIYFLGFMGVRIVFLKYCCDMVRPGKSLEAAVPFLVIFILGGIALAEMIFLGGRYDPINNAVWFRVQSIIAATYFVVYFISSLRLKWQKVAAVAIVVLLSFPSTINFLAWRHGGQSAVITKNQLLAADYIQRAVPGKAIILEYPNWNGPSLSANLAGRSVVFAYFRSFVRAKMGPEALAERDRDLKTFFMIDDEDIRKTIIRKYGVEYLVLPTGQAGAFTRYPWASTLYSNPEVAVCRVDIPR